MKKKHILIVSLLLITFCFISCVNAENNSSESPSYPSLKIVSNYSGYIYRVGLVGYSFDDLRIVNNESKTFELKSGIPGGNDNVNVTVSFRPDSIHIDSRNPASIKCNFQKVFRFISPRAEVLSRYRLIESPPPPPHARRTKRERL